MTAQSNEINNQTNAEGGTMNKLDTIINNAINPQPVRPQEIGEPTNRIVIVGSGHRFETKLDGKRFQDAEIQIALQEFSEKLESAHAKYDEVIYIHGQASGWDRATAEIAEWFLTQEGNEGKVLGRHPNYYTAKGVDAWTTIGKTAGLWRNHRMLEEGINLANKMACQVVWLGWICADFQFSGTHHCRASAEEKGIKTVTLNGFNRDLLDYGISAEDHADFLGDVAVAEQAEELEPISIEN